MSMITSEKFGRICEGVWRDRAVILIGRGILSEEAAILRAVYWRLCNVGVAQGQSMKGCDEEQMLPAYRRLVDSMLTQNAHPPFDGASRLRELVRRCVDDGRSEHRNITAVGPFTKLRIEKS